MHRIRGCSEKKNNDVYDLESITAPEAAKYDAILVKLENGEKEKSK